MSMDALYPAAAIGRKLLATLITSITLTATAEGAVFRTKNFVVTAPSDSIAKQVGLTAEKWRKRLAIEWLGKAMPQWYRPCKVRVRVGQLGAGGATTFSFDRGHVFGWNMRVQGTLERILDSVVPHEVSHTIFASYFRRPLPRWADEGAATLVEHESEIRVQQERLKQAMKNGRWIGFRRLLPMKDYPREMRQVLLLYAEGFSLADYLVQNGGKARYLRFLNDAHESGWDKALKKNYGVSDVESLESKWKEWFLAGSPRLDTDRGEAIAAKSKQRVVRGSPEVVRGSPDPARGLTAGLNNGRTSGETIGRRSGRVGRPSHNNGDIVVRSQTPPPKSTASLTQNSDKSFAPDPKRGGRKHTAGSSITVTTVSEGRRRALNHGWIPIKRRAGGNPATERNAGATGSLLPVRRRAAPFPGTGGQAASGTRSRALPAGAQRSPRDANADWSAFPRRR